MHNRGQTITQPKADHCTTRDSPLHNQRQPITQPRTDLCTTKDRPLRNQGQHATMPCVRTAQTTVLRRQRLLRTTCRPPIYIIIRWRIRTSARISKEKQADIFLFYQIWQKNLPYYKIKSLPLQPQSSNGTLAERLGNGLQNRVEQFDSARYLSTGKSDTVWTCLFLYARHEHCLTGASPE